MATLMQRILELIDNPTSNPEWAVYELVNSIRSGTLLDSRTAVVSVLSATQMERDGYVKPSSEVLSELAKACDPADYTETVDAEIRWNEDEWSYLIPEERRSEFFENWRW